MNPLPIALLLLASQGQGLGSITGTGSGGARGRGGARGGRSAGGGFGSIGRITGAGALDVEPVLNQLHRTVGALERINRMNQIARMPMTRERAPELLDVLGAPPELKNLIQAGSALMARGAQQGMQSAGSLPNFGGASYAQPDMYDDRDPYVTGADMGGNANYAQDFRPPAMYGNGNMQGGGYGMQNQMQPAQMPDIAQLMQTFGPMLKTFMQANNG